MKKKILICLLVIVTIVVILILILRKNGIIRGGETKKSGVLLSLNGTVTLVKASGISKTSVGFTAENVYNPQEINDVSDVVYFTQGRNKIVANYNGVDQLCYKVKQVIFTNGEKKTITGYYIPVTELTEA